MMRGDTKSHNVFSQPWNDSDVVLVVEDKQFYVHRSVLSLQSPVFKAMFEGNFKDAQQDKIELKDDKYKAMLLFLQLLYPANMLDEGKVNINDGNILPILEVADKYTAINVIKQCMKETERIRPTNTMRLLPYAARHNLPVENIVDVTVRRVSTVELERFSTELDDHSVYINTLLRKCRFQEDVAKRAYTTMLNLLEKYVAEVDKQKNVQVSSSTQPVRCIPHRSLGVQDFKEARKCEKSLEAYKKHFIDGYVYPPATYNFWSRSRKTETVDKASEALIELLKDTDDITTSLPS